MEIVLKRVYLPAAPEDGLRVLVDRLWPRGVSKETAELYSWAKAVAPSPDLRKRWHTDPEKSNPVRFAAFAAEYREELANEPASAALDELADLARQSQRLTLVFGAKDPVQNHVVVLREALLERLAAE